MIFNASIAFRIPTEVRPSTVPEAGDGIFALEGLARGKILGMDFPSYRKLCTDKDIPYLASENQKFSWRHIEYVCFEAHDRRSPADLMNHSFDPNVLWHIGVYFARKEIKTGEELLVDYRYLYSPDWNDQLVDSVTGRSIIGLDWRESLIRSSRSLVELLEETESEAEEEDIEKISLLCLALRNRI